MGAMSSGLERGSLSQLFATPVWTFKPRDAERLAEDVAEYLLARRAKTPPRAPGDLWQSRPDLHLAPELGALVRVVDEAGRAALAVLQVECQLAITGLWGNIGGRDSALHEHTHPNNYLSGIFFVRMPEGSGATVFEDPRAEARVLRPKTLKSNPLNSLEFEYQGAPGTLLLFPAWLEHGVRPSHAGAERITIAFNLMVKGPLGDPTLLAYSEI